MNTKNLKSYAPKARKQFIEAVKKRAAHFGIYEDRIAEVRIEGGAAIIEGRAFTRKEGEQRKRLESKVTERGYEMFIREMAYTWFNRLAAIRYMEIHDYFDHGFRVLSPATSHPTNADGLPEILNHASDVAESLNLDKDHIIELQLAGDKEEELYRELLLGQCHHLYKIMPFMFEAIDDSTELLLPNNLTKTDSILKGLINDIPEEDWQEIEVIGWLYQFYISEHKDAVMGKVVKSEDIPAATQLFTPNWIVKYLVQNSVGRQWLATYPNSELKGKMDYYIEPAEQSDDVIEQLKEITPTSIDPEEIKVLDPACGSGHILVEVYEVLREIYLERGYRLREIPELILTKNIYGLDIDDRAAQLAGFALMMKAREDDRRIFQRVEDGEVSLNVFSLQSTENLDIPKIWKALDLEGSQQAGSTGGLFDEPIVANPVTAGTYGEYYELIQTLKSVFLQAKTLGSLIEISEEYLDSLVNFESLLQDKKLGSDPSAKHAAIGLLPIVNQAILLAQKYDAVIANPPYMGRSFYNSYLKDFINKEYPLVKENIFAVFMERAFSLISEKGYNAQINMHNWMFISRFESYRGDLIDKRTLHNMLHLGAGAFPEIGGEVVQSTAFVYRKFSGNDNYLATIKRLIEGNSLEKEKNFNLCEVTFKTSNRELSKIEGYPFVYWATDAIRKTFTSMEAAAVYLDTREGLATADNERFLRYWFEVSVNERCTEVDWSKKWVPYNKGGGDRKWSGYLEQLVNWEDDGKEIKNNIDQKTGRVRSHNYNGEYAFKQGITWSGISSSGFSVRYVPKGHMFDAKGPSAFTEAENLYQLLALLNSKVATFLMSMLAPTLDFKIGHVLKLPVHKEILKSQELRKLALEALKISKDDWDTQETSPNFKTFILHGKGDISEILSNYLENANEAVSQLKSIEEDINSKIISLYQLDSEISNTVDIENVSLCANPSYIYSKKASSEHKGLVIQRLVVAIISYGVGCMMGRFSLDTPGIVYAGSGNNGFQQGLDKDLYRSFQVDDDGIVPCSEQSWLFEDDATYRLKEFIKTLFGEEKFDGNWRFIATALPNFKPKETADTNVRNFLSKPFFKSHYQMYSKRPIYWLFSSGKEKAFECLVYLHRYNEGTLSRMRTEYVTPLMGKYDAQHTLLSEQQLQATGTEARGIEKDLKSLEKKQAELRAFDEQLKHYAEKRITLDLDDGVKANYGKFGNLLADVKAIHGKAVK
ncbi:MULTISPECIES: BREX-1 system adenine-specific DNA-methyltransferase PglX [unclassified Pseudoalteromonas]|uniref:BREX-1 system adenine-specific DNA-methyltransferase PglX n=1 Tax=unclassified Pseudoalteromonas TaxID=194690 RepID=UPI0009780B5F|nr:MULTISPECIES: BREX-1 system adenine-specific DNA-methyltransferase PglX [unclassified Pseudoalteromonas]MDN3490081.1 BREX-1 system adenine-specific DNA-methyltransferase PglX [Pseudoalteromonas sp. APC 3694]